MNEKGQDLKIQYCLKYRPMATILSLARTRLYMGLFHPCALILYRRTRANVESRSSAGSLDSSSPRTHGIRLEHNCGPPILGELRTY